MSTKKGAVVLLSGGLDSSVLLHYVGVRLRETPVHALSVLYGQRHAKELECARIQARRAGVASHEIADLSCLRPLLAPGSALIQGGAAVPDLDALAPEQREQPPTYVPNRNMMLLSVAAAVAEARGLSRVYYGAQAQDEYGYWDCTRPFVEGVNGVLRLNRRNGVEIRTPFLDFSKAAIVRLGLDLGVDLAQTWSCYRGGDTPCGSCPTCVERRKAFEQCGVQPVN